MSHLNELSCWCPKSFVHGCSIVLMICLFFQSCLRPRQSSFHWIVSVTESLAESEENGNVLIFPTPIPSYFITPATTRSFVKPAFTKRLAEYAFNSYKRERKIKVTFRSYFDRV